MSKEFIHIAFDSIFLDYTINQFETIRPKTSQYVVDIPDLDYKIKHIKSSKIITPIVLTDSKQKGIFIESLTSDNVVILHCLNQNMVDIVNKAPLEVCFVWLVWGAEVNSLPRLSKNLYQPYTSKILKQINNLSLKSRLYKKFPKMRLLLYKIKNGKTHPIVQKTQAIKRINYSGIFVKQDFDRFNTIYNFNLKWLWYCYYNIDDTATENFKKFKAKKNILVGNSANPSNNHIDIFNILKQLNHGNKKIICPLSYGADNEEYVEQVEKNGKQTFSANFIPLLKFVPLTEYNGIVGSCNIVIMNHNRQQAVGNILTSIWIGAKVFLNEENPVYKYFTEIGAKVFSIQKDLSIRNKFVLSALNEKDIIENRNILKMNFSKKEILARTRLLIEELDNQND